MTPPPRPGRLTERWHAFTLDAKELSDKLHAAELLADGRPMVAGKLDPARASMLRSARLIAEHFVRQFSRWTTCDVPTAQKQRDADEYLAFIAFTKILFA